MDLCEFYEFIGVYMPLIVSICAQLSFLIYPVGLKNWNDDFLHAFTYVALQALTAAVIFVIIPYILETITFSTAHITLVILAVSLLAFFRVLIAIPLEFTFPILPEKKAPETIDFSSFYSPQHVASLSEQAGSGDYERYLFFKERLIRKKPGEGESILEGIIRAEIKK